MTRTKEAIKRICEETLSKNKNCSVVYLDGIKNIVVPFYPSCYQEKMVMLRALRGIAKINETEIVTFVSEAWMVSTEIERKREDLPEDLEDCEDRIETLMIQTETQFKTEMEIYEIIRDENNKFLRLEVHSTSEELEGVENNLELLEKKEFH